MSGKQPDKPTSDVSTAKHTRAGGNWHYDASENIIFAAHPQPVHLATRDAIVRYFDDGIRYWREHCAARRVYIVVDYGNFTFNLDELDFYAAQVKRIIVECAITIVRYNGSMVQRMASRMTAIKLHTPSNAYSSRDEAIAVVRGLTAGTIQSGSGTR